MDTALIASAALIGLVGAPHCTAMCGAPCGALVQRCGGGRPRAAGAAFTAFLGGRLLGYMAAGAAVAAGVAAFAALGEAAPVLRPLWTLAHVAAIGLGVWLLATGRMPAGLGGGARAAPLAQPVPVGWQRMAGPLGAGAAGSLWLVLPCGLLQSALIVAALASTPAQGAAAMGAFALTSSLGLTLLPALWARWPGSAKAGGLASVWAVRASGAALLAMSSWALGHGLWQRVSALCAGLW